MRILVLTLLTMLALAGAARADDPEPTGTLRIEQRGESGQLLQGGCYSVLRGGEQWVSVCGDGNDAVVVDLPADAYRVEEIRAPRGYKVNAAQFGVSISEGETTTVKRAHEPLPVLSIVTTTADGAPLADSCWLARTPGDNEGGEQACDDDHDGTTRFTVLVPADYELIHLSAPKGYVRLTEPSPVTMADADRTLTFALERVVAPASAEPPSITGDPVVGAVLSGSRGTWTGTSPKFIDQWQRCDGDACEDLDDDGLTHTVTADDAGKALRLVVTARNDAGTATAESARVTIGALTAPRNTAAPAIAGLVGIGQKLTADPGGWTGDPSFSYRWERCADACVEVGTGASYVIKLADAGYRIRLSVSARNAAGEASAVSQPTELLSAAPYPSERPSTRFSDDGKQLIGYPGHWQTYYGGLQFSYRWLRCDPGAGCVVASLGDVHDISDADAGHSLRLEVTATDAGGSRTATSNDRAIPFFRPVSLTPPTFGGQVRVGQELLIHLGDWLGADDFDFRWLRCDADGGACVDTGVKTGFYKIREKDLGHTLKGVVIAVNDNGTTTASTGPSAVVLRHPPVNTAVPFLGGHVRVGEELLVYPGGWDAADDFEFRWLRCDGDGGNCVDTGVKTGFYKIKAKDVGYTLKGVVIGVNADGKTSASTGPSALVQLYPPVNTKAPFLGGKVRVGEELLVYPGEWTGAQDYEYRWLRCDADGSDCADTGTKTGFYKIRDKDLGHTLKGVVIGVNADGKTTASTGPSAVVWLYPPVNTKEPFLGGNVRVGEELLVYPGEWTGAEDFEYRWLRCDAAGENCVDTGVKTGFYKIVSKDVGHTLKGVVIAVNADGKMAASTGPSALVRLYPPVNTAVPFLGGRTQVGEELLVYPGEWTGAEDFEYRWQRCDADGANCADTGVKTGFYKLKAKDAGHALKGVVIAINADGRTSASTGPSAVVAG